MRKISNFTEMDQERKQIVLFSMPTCGPCKMMKPGLDFVQRDFENIGVYEIDATEEPELAAKLNVMSTPTTIYLMDGKEVDRAVGFETVPKIKERLGSI